MDLDGETGKLGIDVVLPADFKGYENLSPPKLVIVWEKEPLLMDIVARISVETSEQVKLLGMKLSCWRFSASVGGN